MHGPAAAILARYADGPVRILVTHFASPVARKVVSAGDAWRIKV